MNKEKLVFAGTYERLLYGLVSNPENTSELKKLEPSFIFPAHISCLTSLAASSRFLATGSKDEQVKIYDLKLRKEIGVLMHHQGTINDLKFVKGSLITCADDGNIGLIRSSDWEVLKSLKGHKGPVLSMDVHSSGKVLLSTGKDKSLKCWDLTRGLLSYSLNLPFHPNKVKWSPCENYYVVFFDNLINIYSLENGDIFAKIESKSRINSGVLMKFEEDTFIIYGGEDKVVRIKKINGEDVKEFNTKHKLRIKDLAVFPKSTYFLTCSSDGLIQNFDMNNVLQDNFEPSEEFDAQCRLTCLLAFECDKPKEKEVVEKVEYPESDYEEQKAEPKLKISFEDSEGKIDLETKKAIKSKKLDFKKNGKKFKVQKKTRKVKKESKQES